MDGEEDEYTHGHKIKLDFFPSLFSKNEELSYNIKRFLLIDSRLLTYKKPSIFTRSYVFSIFFVESCV